MVILDICSDLNERLAFFSDLRYTLDVGFVYMKTRCFAASVNLEKLRQIKD